ncbi:rhodanese-like domain-containing protein [Helicobacter sp. MIT 14-3879]|uniref:rhodanese-like domain-containing protein n=1 Tax=Helicobacter sp. MIT 14-3879 TaxID=2040649 RepID=UPI000E1F915C|nr:rhodanese-like domain-containing protein [Helicobacter sp. MIT 14-3879]RDU62080.1 rhodanese-like domain-containing protein [Helicobacter sp. MIT 14-3879]
MNKAVNLKEFKEKINDFIIIDVRSKGYFLIDHIKNSINIESPQRIEYIAKENKDKNIILYCHHGITARGIVEELKNIDNIYFLEANFSDVVKSGIDIVFYNKE